MAAPNLPDLRPACREHGFMMLRPAAVQTPEQRWCGTWYDCSFVAPKCRTSVLLMSPQLAATYASATVPTI